MLADDHDMVRESLCDSLSKIPEWKVVGQASDGEEALDMLRDGQVPDILIVDINMPKSDGIEVTLHVKKHYPKVKVLILSMHNRSEFVHSLIKSGADGYILKSAGRQQLLEAIRKLAAGQKYFDPEVARTVLNSHLFADTSEQELTDREKEILRMIARGHKSDEIAAALNVSVHTVSTHRKNISIKLNTSNTADWVMYGLKTGIIKAFDVR